MDKDYSDHLDVMMGEKFHLPMYGWFMILYYLSHCIRCHRAIQKMSRAPQLKKIIICIYIYIGIQVQNYKSEYVSLSPRA